MRTASRKMSRPKAINWDYARAKNNLWWYPQDRQTYEVIKHAMRMGSPRNFKDFLVSSLKVLPTMIKRMYFSK